MNTIPLSPTYHLQRLPPAAARGSEPELQFAHRKQHPVATHFEADGEAVSNGIAFEDFARMQTGTRRGRAKRGPSPEWTRNQSTVRAVLVQFFEERAFGRKKLALLPAASEAERLTRACEKLRADVPRKLVVMDRLCNELVALKTAGGDPARQRVLKSEIEGIDTQIRFAQENWPACVLGIIYNAYNVGMDSVGVGAQLGIKPPAVRQTLWRLNQTWKRMVAAQASQEPGV